MLSTLIETLGATDADKILFDVDKGKEFMRVDFIHEDDLIKEQIASATAVCEEYTKRAFLHQRRKQYIKVRRDSSIFNLGEFIHYGPVTSVTSLKPVAKGVVGSPLASGDFYWILEGRLYIDPDLFNQMFDGKEQTFEVIYEAGLPKTELGAKFPALVEAVKTVLHNAWDGRGFNSTHIPPAAKQLMAPYRNLVLTDV